MMRLPTGNSLVLPRHSHSASEVYLTHANMDWGAEELFARFSDRGSDFIDIGAHIGYYSAYLSPLVRHCYAFEPDPRNLPGLRTNAKLSGNIEVLEMAVSSRTGSAQLEVGESSSTSTLVAGHRKTLTVPVTTVDAFMEARPAVRVALIKTDIEGHDIEALRSMVKTVSTPQPLILTECSDTGVIDLCGDWNYGVYAFTRERRTLKTHFQKMNRSGMQSTWFKMLFLVPPHLASAFQEIAIRKT